MINSGALPNVAFRKPQCPDRCGAPSCPSPPRSAMRAGAAPRPQTRTASTRRPHRADPKRPPAARATAAVLVAHREQSSYWPCAQSPFYATPEPARVQHREPRPNGPLFVHGPSASLESDILRGAVTRRADAGALNLPRVSRYERTNGQSGTTCSPRARMSSSAPAARRQRSSAVLCGPREATFSPAHRCFPRHDAVLGLRDDRRCRPAVTGSIPVRSMKT